jgi:hypothetical protein
MDTLQYIDRIPRCFAGAHTGVRHGWASRILVLMLLSVLVAPVFAEGVRAEIDRDRIAANETLTLRLIADGRLSGEPDLQALESGFEILSRGQSERMSVVNGAVSHTREWVLELAPKRPGRLAIPALVWGKATSEPLAVDVVEDDPPGSAAAASKPIFVRSDADQPTPYVQQAFQYSVKVLYRQPPQRAILSEPQVEGATIMRYGEDRSSAEFIDGTRYEVVERRFLVVPLQSGPLTIRGPRLEAVLPDPRADQRGRGSDLDRLFGGGPFAGMPGLAPAGRRILERAPDLDVQIRPQPAGSTTPWLPAESVQLSEEWIPSSPQFQVGEPVTRVLIVTARGVTAAQLPPLDPAAPDGVQIYPGQPRSEDLPGTGSPVATKSMEVAVVPTRAGRVTLPEVRVPWWDIAADEERVAIIPARTIEVAAAPAEATGFSGVVPGASGETPASVFGDDARTRSGRPGFIAEDWLWPALAGLFALGWLATLIRLKRLPWRRRPDTAVIASASQRLRAARQRVEHACLAHDARAARAALLAWGRARWGHETPVGLGAFAERLGDPAASETLARLDRALYADAGEPWDGAAAWQVLEPSLAAFDSAVESRGNAALPELYPRQV